MAKAYEDTKALRLAGLLKRIERGDDFKALCKEVGRLGEDFAGEDVAAAEHSLLRGGYPTHLVSQLGATFVLMRLYEQRTKSARGQLPDSHIIRKVTVEHDLFRCFAAELNDITDTVSSLQNLSDVSSELRRLAHVIGHLHAMKEHMDQEEDVIFPYLKRRRWVGLCRAAQTDHARIRTHLDHLTALTVLFSKIGFEDFKARLVSSVRPFHTTLLEHLRFEDGLLWPVALVIMDDAAAWERIKALCDEIGYCSAHS